MTLDCGDSLLAIMKRINSRQEEILATEEPSRERTIRLSELLLVVDIINDECANLMRDLTACLAEIAARKERKE